MEPKSRVSTISNKSKGTTTNPSSVTLHKSSADEMNASTGSRELTNEPHVRVERLSAKKFDISNVSMDSMSDQSSEAHESLRNLSMNTINDILGINN